MKLSGISRCITGQVRIYEGHLVKVKVIGAKMSKIPIPAVLWQCLGLTCINPFPLTVLHYTRICGYLALD